MKTPAPRVRPLDGITVVTLEHAIAAPYCTRQLADLGARVIKVERPQEGDFARAYDHRTRGLASHFVWTNRSKESLTLDLKQPHALQVLAEWMGFPMYYAYDGQQPPGRHGASHATIYPYGPFRAGDGKVVMLGLHNEREWGLFCEQVLRQPALASDPRFATNAARSAQREALRELIVQAFSRLPAFEVLARLDAAAIANASVNTVGDLWEHPQLHARGRFRAIGSPAGELQALLPPAGSDAFDARMDPVPALGEHTTAILYSLGRDDAQITALRALGAV